MNPIRIQLGPMPTMLSAIVGDLVEAEADMTVVGRCEEGEEALSSARANGADMIITEQASCPSGTCLGALLSGPPLEIFAIATDGQGGDAVSVARRPVTLGQGPGAFAAALRTIGGRG